MPTYEYLCKKCHKINERTFKISDFPKSIHCGFCDGIAGKIISTSGAIQTDNKVPWMESAIKTLQPDYERPIQTRGEYKRYLKEKGITPIG